MSDTNGGKRSFSAIVSIIIAVVLIVMIGLALSDARGENNAIRWLNFGGGEGGGAGTTTVEGIIGSEKRDYFEDPEVKSRLAELGYTVKFSTAGSRQIATNTCLLYTSDAADE